MKDPAVPMDANQPTVTRRPGMSRVGQSVLVVLLAAVAVAAIELGPRAYRAAFPAAAPEPKVATPDNTFKPSKTQLAGLTIKPVGTAMFRAQRSADGKIAIDDDRNTPVYAPYSGRVTQVFVKAGDAVAAGAPLFRMDSTDLVQAQNDYITAAAALSKAQSAAHNLATAYRRQQALFDVQGAALKDVQQAQTDLTGAQSDQHAAEVALAAVRDRLRILGIGNAAILKLDATRRTDPSLIIPSPLAGVVTLRKLGPGQYLTAGASDPVLAVGDLKKVWLIANARESDAGSIHVGDKVDVHVTAYPDRVFSAAINYVAPTVDPNTHRLPIRAEVQNDGDALKPEMFASFTIDVSGEHMAPAVPESAVIYDGETVRVWVVGSDGTLAGREIKAGVTNDGLIEVVSGLSPGENIVTKGSIFVDRAASDD